MLSIPSNATIYMAVEPVDMRKSFDGLAGLVTSVFQQNVFDGHLFLFVNRRRDRMKILWWDHDGLAIWMKRLERGTYETPPHDQQAKQIRMAEKMREARHKGQASLSAKMWVYSGLVTCPYNCTTSSGRRSIGQLKTVVSCALAIRR